MLSSRGSTRCHVFVARPFTVGIHTLHRDGAQLLKSFRHKTGKSHRLLKRCSILKNEIDHFIIGQARGLPMMFLGPLRNQHGSKLQLQLSRASRGPVAPEDFL